MALSQTRVVARLLWGGGCSLQPRPRRALQLGTAPGRWGPGAQSPSQDTQIRSSAPKQLSSLSFPARDGGSWVR